MCPSGPVAALTAGSVVRVTECDAVALHTHSPEATQGEVAVGALVAAASGGGITKPGLAGYKRACTRRYNRAESGPSIVSCWCVGKHSKQWGVCCSCLFHAKYIVPHCPTGINTTLCIVCVQCDNAEAAGI